MTTLEHIGIAVTDVDAVASLLEGLLGMRRYKSETVPREGVATHFLGAGETKLELLEALGPESPVARFLTGHGEGVHHLAFEVESVHDILDRARGMGLTPLSVGPQPGADRKLVAFFHPRETHGLLIEICESIPPETEDAMDDASITAFGAPRPPAVVIIDPDGERGVLWSAVAAMLESDFYTVLIHAHESRVDDLLQRLFEVDERTHLVVESALLNWATRYSSREREGVLTAAVCSLEEARVTVTVVSGTGTGEVYRIPAVSPRSRRSMRLLAQLLAGIVRNEVVS